MSALAFSPFDVITCDDVRLVEIYGYDLGRLGSAPIASIAACGDPHDRAALDGASGALQSWADAVAAASIDELAEELLGVWERSRGHRRQPAAGKPPALSAGMREAVVARLGLHGQAPVMLKDACNLAGVSKQRVQQVVAQFEAVADRWVWAPALDAALHIGDGTLTGAQYSKALADAGLTRGGWHPDAVNSLARLCGRTERVRVASSGTPVPAAEVTNGVRKAATELIRQLTVAPLGDITTAAAKLLDRAPSEDETVAALTHHGRFVVADGWVAGRGHARPAGRLAWAAKGMAAVALRHGGLLTVADVRHGLQRRLRAVSGRVLPSVEAVHAQLCAHGDFIVDAAAEPAGSTVRLRAEPPPLDRFYGKTACALIDLICAAPHQIASRTELIRAAKSVGVHRDAVTQCLYQHEAFVSAGYNLWTLAGFKPSATVIARAHAMLPVKKRQAPIDGRTTDGHPWWLVTITAAWRRHNTIERVSMARHPGSYQALDGQGNRVGTISIRPNGVLYGLRTYVLRHAVKDGTKLRIDIDPQAASATITTT